MPLIDWRKKKSKVDKSKVCVCLFDFFQAFFMGGCGCTTMFAAKARCQYKFSIEVYYVRETKKLVKNLLEKIINSIPVITWSQLTLSSPWGRPHGASFSPSRNPPLLNYFVENGELNYQTVKNTNKIVENRRMSASF